MPLIAPPVPGLRYLPGYLCQEEQDALLDVVDSQPWLTDLKRRVQHYGYRYDYRRKTVSKDMYLGALPGWAAELAARIRQDGIVQKPFDQMIVNEYEPGQGIADHVDCLPCFGEEIVSLSLGSRCVIRLRSLDRTAEFPLVLVPGSLLLLSGDARYKWSHGIPGRKRDVVDSRALTRGRRVSLTFRTVLPR
ncbi:MULTISPECIES: alpha-ketoglutarate-dependent dioxygenase AlkB [unclassified Crossiella]|uniref:alpha-ketoglutarate-dependent dioxygenase AlkB n=1 Tax=unclassified Crossiella TaxID=2620835 RepID=UPI001FFF7984|nr:MULTISPECIES: alpha-ketoglutarate-dependent dioxygenase AlkB [unclassified Crossiella]MCK2242406.1 alpha-ketoglutarate-dependent dioxygenase AlkB [Crossiella sp. S99.2]MCK2254563.1 alpha-ketoglutarate-dependent dioxygenase AlkB [Crossiella sp. S99.1]